MKLWTPTRLRNGEGRTNREATDVCSGWVRRGSGRGMKAKGDRSQRREAPREGARDSNVVFQGAAAAGESDRAEVVKKRGKACGARPLPSGTLDNKQEGEAIGDEAGNA